MILVAQDTMHIGAAHGLVSNGGKKSIGNYIVEFVNNGSPYATVQIYQCALGVDRKVQTWNRTKTVTKKATTKKKKAVKQETMKVNTEVEQESLF